MEKKFVHLHLHDHYSLLDGIGTPPQVVARAVELGMDAIAETNHGTCGGFFTFYNECVRNKIKPILGVEAYIVDDMLNKDKTKPQFRYHINLLAKNANGVRNIHRLVSAANTDGFYYKPRIDFNCLNKYKEDIIVLTACASGYIPALLHNVALGTKTERQSLIEKRIRLLKDNFGKDVYFEIMPNEMKIQSDINLGLMELSHKHDIKTVATNDCHYVDFEDMIAHDTLLMIQSKTTIKDPNRWKMEARKLHITTYKEMMIEFGANHKYMTKKETEAALDLTNEIASKVDIKLDYSKYVMPKFDIPKEYESNVKYIRSLINESWTKKGIGKYENKSEYQTRIEYELKVIQDKGLIDYFLIVRDFIQWSKDNGIYVGVGRGSAAGSLVAFMLGITGVDPIKFGLLFERFLNPERQNYPDIDSDFEHERREDVKQYIIKKYGASNVAGIGTYSTLSPNHCFRDVCRAYDVPYLKVNSLAKTLVLKDDKGNPATIGYNISINDKLKRFEQKSPDLVKIMKRLEFQYRHCSVAAGGILITDSSITDYMALRMSKKQIITEWDKYDIDDAKLLKIDILGIQTLSIIKNTLKMVGKDLDWLYNLPLNDSKVMTQFALGETDGTFQFESMGMKKILKKMETVVFEDLVAINSLYRPGSMEFIDNYIDRKYGREPINYPFPDAEKYLRSTYGLCLYQEQLMYIASEFGGLSLGEADILRKCKEKVTEENKNKIKAFKEKIVKLKGDNQITKKVLAFIDGVGGYSFNRSHSVCYALLGYYTMYLKVHYPLEFSLSILNNAIGKIDDTRRYTRMAKKLGVKVKSIDINSSMESYTIDKDKNIVKGFVSVKGVGDKAAQHIISKRPYKNFEDYISKISKKTCNKKVTEVLVALGAFEDIEPYKETKAAMVDSLGIDPLEMKPRYFYELKHLGYFEKKNPLKLLKEYYDAGRLRKMKEIYTMKKGTHIALACVIMDKELFTNYKGEESAIIKITDGGDVETCIVDGDMYIQNKAKLEVGKVMICICEKIKHKTKNKEPILKMNNIVKIFVKIESLKRYTNNSK